MSYLEKKKKSEVKSSNCHYKDKNQFEECIREIVPTWLKI